MYETLQKFGLTKKDELGYAVYTDEGLEFAKEILKGIGKEVELIPVNTTDEARPLYSVLDNMMLRLDGLHQPAEWKAALAEYLSETGGNE